MNNKTRYKKLFFLAVLSLLVSPLSAQPAVLQLKQWAAKVQNRKKIISRRQSPFTTSLPLRKKSASCTLKRLSRAHSSLRRTNNCSFSRIIKAQPMRKKPVISSVRTRNNGTRCRQKSALPNGRTSKAWFAKKPLQQHTRNALTPLKSRISPQKPVFKMECKRLDAPPLSPVAPASMNQPLNQSPLSLNRGAPISQKQKNAPSLSKTTLFPQVTSLRDINQQKPLNSRSTFQERREAHNRSTPSKRIENNELLRFQPFPLRNSRPLSSKKEAATHKKVTELKRAGTSSLPIKKDTNLVSILKQNTEQYKNEHVNDLKKGHSRASHSNEMSSCTTLTSAQAQGKLSGLQPTVTFTPEPVSHKKTDLTALSPYKQNREVSTQTKTPFFSSDNKENAQPLEKEISKGALLTTEISTLKKNNEENGAQTKEQPLPANKAIPFQRIPRPSLKKPLEDSLRNKEEASFDAKRTPLKKVLEQKQISASDNLLEKAAHGLENKNIQRPACSNKTEQQEKPLVKMIPASLHSPLEGPLTSPATSKEDIKNITNQQASKEKGDAASFPLASVPFEKTIPQEVTHKNSPAPSNENSLQEGLPNTQLTLTNSKGQTTAFASLSGGGDKSFSGAQLPSPTTTKENQSLKNSQKGPNSLEKAECKKSSGPAYSFKRISRPTLQPAPAIQYPYSETTLDKSLLLQSSSNGSQETLPVHVYALPPAKGSSSTLSDPLQENNLPVSTATDEEESSLKLGKNIFTGVSFKRIPRPSMTKTSNDVQGSQISPSKAVPLEKDLTKDQKNPSIRIEIPADERGAVLFIHEDALYVPSQEGFAEALEYVPQEVINTWEEQLKDLSPEHKALLHKNLLAVKGESPKVTLLLEAVAEKEDSNSCYTTVEQTTSEEEGENFGGNDTQEEDENFGGNDTQETRGRSFNCGIQ